MGISTSQLETDLSYMIADLPVTFQFLGGVYQGVVTDISKNKEGGTGWFEFESNAQLHAKRSSFATLPTTGKTVGINGSIYRISNIVLPPDGIAIVLDLTNKDK